MCFHYLHYKDKDTLQNFNAEKINAIQLIKKEKNQVVYFEHNVLPRSNFNNLLVYTVIKTRFDLDAQQYSIYIY